MKHNILDEYKKLHSEGRLSEAKEGYLIILNNEPTNWEALHYLGILLAEQEEYEAAQEMLIKAIKLQPNDSTLKLHLANIKKSQGDLAAASDVLSQLIESHPTFAAAQNNLGTVFYLQNKWQEAINAYQAAIDIQPDYLDAYYNLALTLRKANRLKEASHVYEALLSLAPNHPGAHFQYGCLLMTNKNFPKAIEHFLFLDKMFPHHFETQVNLATCYLQMGNIFKAKLHYQKALALSANDAQVLFNLGVIATHENRVHEAIDYYHRAICLHSDNFAAQQNLGSAYLMINDRKNALIHYREALRLQPGNEVIIHTIKILQDDKQLTASPPAYIQALFDSYADHFDAHLVEGLQYNVPEQLFNLICQYKNQPASLDILDIGCGTGLCGVVLKPIARTLVGIDLSEKMLQIAAEKKCYDHLIQTDIVSYLVNKMDTFDLIVAGDVVVYYGDLSELFASVHSALKSTGMFAFNVEVAVDDGDFQPSSGRFAHNQHYIERLATEYHFTILQQKDSVIRTQNRQPLYGCLYILGK
ncbi:MAG: tetratricopeptide repeat family protein [uncultured bacterium]|nr:MAG: tetratricopeptide repeat family protein [uncultured bacterium]